MTISDVFFIKGRGAVATGQIEMGSVRVGDELTMDGGRTLKVDGIEMLRKVLDEAKEGDNVGLLFRSIKREDLTQGAVLTGAGGGGGATAASIGLEG
ncbi:MAG: hypothetical protein QOF76_4958 [Solirubrobacteraceae bacterium]|nr:hypothetical protein [Solirubrobacteraceae bacterium]